MALSRLHGVLSTILLFALAGSASVVCAAPAPSGYEKLVRVFEGWRAFEQPVMHGAVPDYSVAAMAAKARELPAWRKRLDDLDTRGWPIEQIDDYRLVKAEMDGFDFNLRVLRPWARDPAFYVSVWAARSDCPLREGPLAYPAIELYNFRFPLSDASQHELTERIGAIPGLLTQARQNLKESNARDLWIWGGQELRNQSETLISLEAGSLTVSTLEGSQKADLTGASPELHTAIVNARKATDDFVAWLNEMAPGKTGPSGVGKENYDWYQKNVHFVPFTWQEQVVLLRRELERAHAALRLEEQNNRNLPPLEPVADEASFDRMTQARLDKFVAFLSAQEIIPDKPYIKAALEPQLGHFVPEDQRIFFTRVTHREPMLQRWRPLRATPQRRSR